MNSNSSAVGLNIAPTAIQAQCASYLEADDLIALSSTNHDMKLLISRERTIWKYCSIIYTQEEFIELIENNNNFFSRGIKHLNNLCIYKIINSRGLNRLNEFNNLTSLRLEFLLLSIEVEKALAIRLESNKKLLNNLKEIKLLYGSYNGKETYFYYTKIY